jgi:hypothetical protein
MQSRHGNLSRKLSEKFRRREREISAAGIKGSFMGKVACEVELGDSWILDIWRWRNKKTE